MIQVLSECMASLSGQTLVTWFQELRDEQDKRYVTGMEPSLWKKNLNFFRNINNDRPHKSNTYKTMLVYKFK